MQICVFEDRGWEDLVPLTYARPACLLLCGARSLLDKIRRLYPNVPIRLSSRDYLQELAAEEAGLPVNAPPPADGTLFLNGRLLLTERIALEGREEFAAKEGVLLFARLGPERSAVLSATSLLSNDPAAALRGQIPEARLDGKLLRYYWDFVDANPGEIVRELTDGAPRGVHGKLYEGVHLVNPGSIFIGEGARIKPGVVIDADEGPVWIGEGTVVSANSSIEGPVYIGRNCLVQATARLRPGTSLGEVSKVGGEIEEAIIQGYSNKQHDGFLGHAFVGSWVNLAADTINSDLKNTYGTVRVVLGRRTVETGKTFVGLAIGDHSKSAVNSSFLTGSVVGFGANVLMARFPPKFVPSFSWCTDGGLEPYRLDKALEVARLVMARRKKSLTPAAERVFREVYELTAPEREAAIEEWEE